MKARYLAQLVLTFLVISSTALVSSTALAERFPVRQEFGQQAGHGRATVTDTPQGGNGGGGLVVSNIGSSGDDGIDFHSGGTRGSIGPIRWMAPEFLAGRGMNFLVSGRDADGSLVEVTFSTMGIEEGFGGDLDQNQVNFNPMATGMPSLSFTVHSNGNPVHEENGASGQNPLFESSTPPIGATAGGSWGDISGVFDHFRFQYPPGTAFDLMNGEIVVGDAVSVSFDPWSTEMVSLDLMRVTGIEPVGSTGEIFVVDWPAGMFGQVVANMGEAEALGIGSSGLDGVDRLRVSNIGSSGLDGVYMHADGNSTSQALALEFPSPPVAGNKLFVGGLSYSEGDGSGAKLPTVEASYHVDSFFDIWPVASSPTPSRIDYLTDDETVYSVLNPSSGAQLYTSVQYPYRLEYAAAPDGSIEVEVLFANPVTFQDSNGLDNDCDGVRLVFPPEPVLPFDPWDGTFLRASDLPTNEFVVTGIPNVLPPTAASTWTSANGLGSANVVSQDDGSLMADNINDVQGVAGMDGLRVSWPHGNRGMGMTMSTRSKRPPPTRGHVTVLKAFGSGGDKADHRDGIVILTGIGNDEDTLIEYGADMSPVGTSTVTWNFYDGGQLVATETRDNSETCFGCDAIPSSFSVSLNPTDGRPLMSIEFPDARPITLIGGSSAGQKMNKADLVEVLANGSIVTPFTDVTDISWRGTGQGAMFVTNAGPVDVSTVPSVVKGSPLTLHPAAPNPFNPRTVIAFDIRQDAEITLQVFDARGFLVQTLFRGHHAAGTYRETWNGLDSRGRSVASGTYFFRLEGAGSELVRKAVLIR